MDEVEPVRGEGHFQRLTGDGIDKRKLLLENEIEFGIELNPSQDDHGPDYFDGEQIFKNLNFDCTHDGADSDNDQTPFERMASNMKDITPTHDKGVLKQIVTHGTGNKVPQGASVKVHYNAYLEYSEEPFDSSILRNYPVRVKLGAGEQILGWEIAIPTMKKGEKSRFLVKSEYAYGKMGCPPRIPANATVLFLIEVLHFVDEAKADEFDNSTREQIQKMTFRDRLCLADSLRQRGNDEFKNKRYTQALKTYRKAVDQMETSRLADEEEERTMEKTCLTLYLNASICGIKIGNWRNAAIFARKALRIDKKSVKANYRLGKALGQMSEFEDARKLLLEAQRLDPKNREVRAELEKLNNNLKKFQQMDKMMCSKMFEPTSNPRTSNPTASASNTETSGIVSTEEDDASQGMLDFIKNKIRDFQDDSSQKELPLPPSLKPNELENVVAFAIEEGLVMGKDEETGMSCIKKQ
eukprot:Seg748.1 transcript_id=Seg748.1/GoldUCD/mRNA.D3Y31 product="Inactive peptidyl-prolyl cis-trans isomerase FKBP6" protein_id=Seg748.1/GoldUCD/D3Y31